MDKFLSDVLIKTILGLIIIFINSTLTKKINMVYIILIYIIITIAYDLKVWELIGALIK
jgi:hypothetical protein